MTAIESEATEPEATEPEDEAVIPGVSFEVDGKALVAHEGEQLIDACERNGIHIPRFCYHPRMRPVGMCRMCLVEVDTGRGPALTPSCMLAVSEGMKVQTESEPTKKAQDGVLELTLINHPLDCPVCDKGGECPLQDNAYAFGPGESRFVEEKRHFEKPIPISDLVLLDRERCILCDRCTRFASEVAGDPLIHFTERGSQTQVSTFPDHPFSSYFGGNTVQICPVGALTAKPYRFKARPWDLADTESTSTVDSTGARIVLQSSRDELVRILGVDSEAVNWSWLSDKDRFSYEASNSPDRLTEPLVRSEANEFRPARWSDALKFASESLAVEADRVAVIGGARLPVEGQFAWARLLELAGITGVDAQLGDGLPGATVKSMDRATIASTVANNGVIVLLAADPKEELPTLYLRLRHAAENDGASIIELTPAATGLTPYTTLSIRSRPGSVAQIARAIAAGETGQSIAGVDASEIAAANELLTSGRPVTIIVGRQNLAEDSSYVVAAASAISHLVPGAKFLPATRRGNINGAIELGLVPDDAASHDCQSLLRAAADGHIDTLVLLGADPIADFPDRALVKAAFDQVDSIVAIDTFLTQSSARADVVLPAAAFGEVEGSFVNLERRISPLRAKVTARGQSRPDWMIAAELATGLGHDLGFVTIAELRQELSATVPAFSGLSWDSLDAAGDGPVLNEAMAGDSINAASPSSENAGAENTDAESTGLALLVDRRLWDSGTMVQQSSSLANQAEMAQLCLSSIDFERLDLAEGDVVTVNRVDANLPAAHPAKLSAHLDRGLNAGTVRIPFSHSSFDAGKLIDVDLPVIYLTVETN